MDEHMEPPRRQLNRRQFIRNSTAAGLMLAAPPVSAAARLENASTPGRIDRRALVQRHNPSFTKFDPYGALTVGNGEFAFTADITGLQTFTEQCNKSFPLCTTAHWAWHSTPIPAGLSPEQFRYKEFDTHGRPVGYATDSKGQEPLFNWLRQNPHRLHLGRLGLEFSLADGQPVRPEHLKNARQTLDLWTGLLDSRFDFEGSPVRVLTCCHHELDAVGGAHRIPALGKRQAAVGPGVPLPCA